MKYARFRQGGAALLTAMLTVTLVATFAAAALWQQWRAAEIEAAERARAQASWILVGALDWSRLILREDARAGGVDHLSEPWAVPLQEARLSSFLASEKNVNTTSLEGLPDAFLSGGIVDAQSKLNVTNLVGVTLPTTPNAPQPAPVAAFIKLFQLLGLPASEAQLLIGGIQRAGANATTGTGTPTGTPSGVPGTTTAQAPDSTSPLMPQQLRQLVWLGLSPQTVAALEPYVTVLPVATPLNINTASAQALAASLPSLDLASAKQLVTLRTQRYFDSLAAAQNAIPQSAGQFTGGQHSVSTSYFEATGRLRLENRWLEEHSLLRRDGTTLTIIWRERGTGTTAPPAQP